MALPQKTVLYIQVKDTSNHEKLLSAKQIMSQYQGLSEVVMVLGEDKASAVRLPFCVDITDELEKELVQLFGKDCVIAK